MTTTIDRGAILRQKTAQRTFLAVTLLFACHAPAPAALSKYRAETMRVRGQSMKALSALWRQQPVEATKMGVHRFDGTLASYSARSRAAHLAEVETFIRAIGRVDTRVLTPDDRADRQLILASLSARRLELAEICRWQRDPTLYADECVNGVYYLHLRQGAPAAARYAAAAKRLAAIPRVIAEMRANVRNPSPTMALAASDIFAHGADYLEETMPALATESGAGAGTHATALGAATRAMRAAAADLRARSASVTGSAAIGRSTYERTLRTEYFATFSSDSLLRLGEQALAVAGETPRVVQASLFGRGGDTRPPATSPAALGEVVVVETPAFMRPVLGRDAVLGPAPFEQPYPGEHNVSRQRLRTVGRSLVFAAQSSGTPAADLREVFAPHHLQLTLSGRNIDPVRKAQDCAAFTEAWASWKDVRDPRAMAARAIVDVRVNRGDWTAERAVAYLREAAGMTHTQATQEVRHCYRKPGAFASALLYREQIVALREDYRRAHGIGSDKSFNDALLACGSMPPAIARDLLLATR
jgi:uncharacterized protein (DUF885 family)